jgi:hypothetical protein
MDPGTYLLCLLIVIALFGVISGAVAQARGHNFWLFFVLGALISPLLALILAFVIPPPKVRARRRRVRRRGPVTGTVSRTGQVGRPPARDRNPYAPPAPERPYRRQ